MKELIAANEFIITSLNLCDEFLSNLCLFSFLISLLGVCSAYGTVVQMLWGASFSQYHSGYVRNVLPKQTRSRRFSHLQVSTGMRKLSRFVAKAFPLLVKCLLMS